MEEYVEERNNRVNNVKIKVIEYAIERFTEAVNN